MAAYQKPLSVDPKHKRNQSFTSFESWMILKGSGLEGKERSWANVKREPNYRSSDYLAEELRKKGKGGTDALLALNENQREHVRSLVEEKRHEEKQPDAEWSWVRIDLEFSGKIPRGVKRTSKDARAICVTLQRTVKIAESGPSTEKDLDERFREMNLHEDDEHAVQVSDSREHHRGLAFSGQSPRGGHQRPEGYQGQLHIPQPNASGSAPVLPMGELPVSQRWTEYSQAPQASDRPGHQHGYPPPPLDPVAHHTQMTYPGPQRTMDVGDGYPEDSPNLFGDNRYLHLRDNGAFRSHEGSQCTGSDRGSGVFQHTGLPDPHVGPRDIESWRKDSTGPTYLPGRQGRDREDLDDSSRAQRGNKYYKHERSYHPDSRSTRYYKYEESVVQPASTRRHSPRDDNRYHEPRPRRRDGRLSPRVSHLDRQEPYPRSPPPKHHHHRHRPRSPSPGDGRRGRDRTSRKNPSYTPNDDEFSSGRISSTSPSPMPQSRRAKERSRERRDEYSPTRTSRKERREYKRRETSPAHYRREYSYV
ncbi:hypothetical protein BDV97DRAFT_401539 [Delphinella strobiligena]|nr:hypothetical protein BDV97DRAFT_401539 [Delphinella strobiligena]